MEPIINNAPNLAQDNLGTPIKKGFDKRHPLLSSVLASIALYYLLSLICVLILEDTPDLGVFLLSAFPFGILIFSVIFYKYLTRKQ